MVCATATVARFAPRCTTNLSYCADRKGAFFLMAALAHWLNVAFPLAVLLLCRFPALSLFPEDRPAQLDRCFSVAN